MTNDNFKRCQKHALHLFRSNFVIILLAFISTISFSASAKICLQFPNFPTGQYQFEDDIKVPSFDGTELAINLFTPINDQPAQGYPAIIFANSWVLDEHEYLIQAKQFAEKGYIVLSYSARGWGCSDGQVNVAGDKDVTDVSALIDWLLANTPVDANNIGISGISYGSGISLLALAKEPRLKTAVAMSTWGSLGESLYQEQTPRMFWGFLLVSSGFLTADLEPVIARNYANLIFNQNIPETLEWAKMRSVDQYINLINERNAPVYLANNLGDNLFQPNNLLEFYQNLTVPKRIDLNQGTHASGEGFGLIGLESFTWTNTHRWFDYWLKGEATGIMNDAPVTMEVAHTGERDHFNNYPLNETETQRFYLKARGLFTQGGLQRSSYSPWWPKSNQIFSGLDTIATTGIPLVSEILDAHLNLPVKTPMGLISRVNGIVFQSDKLDSTMSIRGIPKLDIRLEPSLAQFQLNAYLYDVDRSGIGTLITHGPITKYRAVPFRSESFQWDLVATAYDIPQGHRLAIAFDTFDALYAVPTLLPYSVKFNFSSGQDSFLEVPTRAN